MNVLARNCTFSDSLCCVTLVYCPSKSVCEGSEY